MQTNNPDNGSSSEAAAEEFLSREAAAKLLCLSPSTLATWASLGKKDAPPMRRHGRRAVYAKSDLFRWSESKRTR
jgi:hypothetical protein